MTTPTKSAVRAAEAVAKRLDDLFACGLATNEACLNESVEAIAAIIDRETGVESLANASRAVLEAVTTTRHMADGKITYYHGHVSPKDIVALLNALRALEGKE